MSNQLANHQSQIDYSHKLQDNHLHLSQIRIYSNNSLVILLESFLIKARKFFREQHLDINVPRAIVVIALISSVFLMIQDRKDKSKYDVSKDVGALIGAGIGILFTMTTLHNQYHYNKRDKASHYMKEWHNESFLQSRKVLKEILEEGFYNSYPPEFSSDLFNKCHSTLVELKKSSDGIEVLKEAQSKILLILKSDKNKEVAILAILNFFEQMGQDIKLQVADSEYLKDYFYLLIIDNYEFLRKYIEYLQFKNCNQLLFCNFVYLAQTWEKEGSLPSLPKICNRPLIITSQDLDQVDKKLEEIKEKAKA